MDDCQLAGSEKGSLLVGSKYALVTNVRRAIRSCCRMVVALFDMGLCPPVARW